LARGAAVGVREEEGPVEEVGGGLVPSPATARDRRLFRVTIYDGTTDCRERRRELLTFIDRAFLLPQPSAAIGWPCLEIVPSWKGRALSLREPGSPALSPDILLSAATYLSPNRL
jgi:hypothetical protein